MSRRLWIVNGVVLLLVLLAAGGTTYALTKSSSSTNSTLRTTPVGRGTVAETVTAAGSVTTAASATLNFGVSGKIAEVRVKLGDHVTTGQTLARLDGEFAQANLTAADAQVAADEQALADAEYQKDHPAATTTAAAGASTASATSTMAATSTMPKTATAPVVTTTPAAAGVAPAPAPVAPAGTGSVGGVMMLPGSNSVPTDGRGQRFSSSTPGSGIEDLRPMADQTSTAGTSTAGTSTAGTSTAGTSTAGTATAGTATAGTASTSTSSTTAKTSADPGEAQVLSAEATLDTARANRITAFQATQNLDLVAPEDGTIVSLDGLVGQVAGPEGIVLSSTATGNPAGGRLPDGSAISSGAGSGQSTTTGSSTSSGGGGGAAAATTGATGSSTATSAPVAPAVMTIANLAAMQVLAQVPELDVGKVANAQPVAVSVNALPGQRSRGR